MGQSDGRANHLRRSRLLFRGENRFSFCQHPKMADLLNSNVSAAMAQRQPFNPWDLPDTFTIYNFAPEEIRSFLHPHWHNQKAPHPMMYYFLGLLYLVIGTIAVSGNSPNFERGGT